jgi:S-formylglutathione hydrolase FrmB
LAIERAELLVANPHEMPRALRFAVTLFALSTTACNRAVVVTSPSPASSSATRGTTSIETFYSEALGADKRVVVYVPPSYSRDASRRYPVAYYLHGLSGSQGDWTSKGDIIGAADSLFATGTPEMIVVMPDGDDGWYTSWTSQLSYRACADTVRQEAPSTYCVPHQRYDDYIAKDLVRFVDAHFRTRADRTHRGLGGLSMGGYGALALSLKYPDVFSAGASHSGVVAPMYSGPKPFVAPARFASTAAQVQPIAQGMWPRFLSYWGTDIARWNQSDVLHLAMSLRDRGGTMPALFFDVGVDDGYVDQNRALHAEFTRLGIAHSYAEWPGAHTWLYWSTHVRQSLAWLGGYIGHQ